MRLTPTPELMIAGASGLLILCAASWWVLAESRIDVLGSPTIRSEPLMAMRAAVPIIGDFQRDYYTNDLDPFVPYDQRIITRNHINDTRFHPQRVGPKHKPMVEPNPPPPPIHWPHAAASTPVIPVCVGWIATEGGSCLLAHMSTGPSVAIQMHIGDGIPSGADSAHRWTLMSITDDGMAVFRDPAGKDEVFPIGGPQQDPPAEADPEPTNTSDGPAKQPSVNGQGQGNQGQKRPHRRRNPQNEILQPNQGGQGGQMRRPVPPPLLPGTPPANGESK